MWSDLKRFLQLPAIVNAMPFQLTNGTLADADEVMGNFNFIAQQVNANAVASVDWSKVVAVKTNVQVFGTTPTLVTFQSVAFDPTIEFSLTDSQFRAANAGYYYISTQMNFDTLSALAFITGVTVFKNGVATNIFSNTNTPNIAQIWSATPAVGAIQLIPNDTLEIRANCQFANGITTDAAANCLLTIFRLG